MNAERAEQPLTPGTVAVPGVQLKAQREEMGWTVEQVADQLKLAPRQVVALEEGDLAALPNMAVVRGFIRAYAKVVKLDAGPLVAMIAVHPADSQAAAAMPRREISASFSEARFPSMTKRSSNPAGWIIGAVLLAGAAAVGAYQAGFMPSSLFSSVTKDSLGNASGTSVLPPALADKLAAATPAADKPSAATPAATAGASKSGVSVTPVPAPSVPLISVPGRAASGPGVGSTASGAKPANGVAAVVPGPSPGAAAQGNPTPSKPLVLSAPPANANLPSYGANGNAAATPARPGATVNPSPLINGNAPVPPVTGSGVNGGSATPQAGGQKVDATPAAASPADASGNSLVLKVREDSWIELRPGRGMPLVARVIKAGTTETFPINEPVLLVVGNPGGVDANLRGTVLPLAQMPVGKPARLNLK